MALEEPGSSSRQPTAVTGPQNFRSRTSEPQGCGWASRATGAGEEEVVAVQREAVSCSDPAVREQLLARKREGRRAAAGEEAPWLLGCGNGGREPVRSGRAWAGAGGGSGGWRGGVGLGGGGAASAAHSGQPGSRLSEATGITLKRKGWAEFGGRGSWPKDLLRVPVVSPPPTAQAILLGCTSSLRKPLESSPSLLPVFLPVSWPFF